MGINKALYKFYLQDRYQRVSIYNKNTKESIPSNWEKVKHGVPKGFLIGLLLYLIYINDLPALIIKPHLFCLQMILTF
jgi:hypothetical protein